MKDKEVFEFDRVPDRRGTDSVKWDFAAERAGGIDHADELLPLWVADMDFPAAPCIVEALRRRVDHRVFGYVSVPPDYYEAVDRWFATYHGYRVDPQSVIVTTGVVPAISAIIKGLTRVGEGVMIFTPVYNCFFSSIRNNGCRMIDVPLLRHDTPDGGFTYQLDRDAIESRLPEARLLLLCNPHNPAGRVWTRQELQWLCDACHRHHVTVVSDEIHCELTRPGVEFVSWATISQADSVVCCSPSKAFNTAGLHMANILAPDPALRTRIDRAINDNEVCDVTPFGVAGLIAAYNHGHPWLEALRLYLDENYRLLRDFFRRELPQYRVADLEGTYLAWVDITPYPFGTPGRCADPREMPDALERGGVKVCGGEMYGDPRFIRINFACPRARLIEGLTRIARVLKQ